MGEVALKQSGILTPSNMTEALAVCRKRWQLPHFAQKHFKENQPTSLSPFSGHLRLDWRH